MLRARALMDDVMINDLGPWLGGAFEKMEDVC